MRLAKLFDDAFLEAARKLEAQRKDLLCSEVRRVAEAAPDLRRGTKEDTMTESEIATLIFNVADDLYPDHLNSGACEELARDITASFADQRLPDLQDTATAPDTSPEREFQIRGSVPHASHVADLLAMLTEERGFHAHELSNLREDIEVLTAERDQLLADLRDAAGELLVRMPMPGSETAKLLSANRLLRSEVQKVRGDLRDAEGSEVLLALALDSLTTGGATTWIEQVRKLQALRNPLPPQENP